MLGRVIAPSTIPSGRTVVRPARSSRSNAARRHHLPPRPSCVPALAGRNGPVVALHQRDVVAVGALGERSLVAGDRMVAARGTRDEPWWLPAAAVWADGDRSGLPERPQPIGLATSYHRDGAVTAGLSDRLGWEAVLEFERGTDLAVAPHAARPGRLIVLDGRIGHDVPTVVTLGDDIVRWGAASTWPRALERAMYGHDVADDVGELDVLAGMLAKSGLEIASVDLGTPRLERAGIVRASVQLLAATPWDGRGTRDL
jgi:hypothetical protein